MNREAEELVRTGQTKLRFPFSELVPPVIRGFEQLLAHPDRDDPRWCVDFYQNDDPDDGLVKRADDERKFFFHYRTRLPRILEHRGVDLTPHKQWLTDCQALYLCLYRQMVMFANELDRALHGYEFLERVLAMKPTDDTHVLRLLMYQGEFLEGLLAKPHCDRAFLTAHVDESDPGMILEGTPITVRENEARVFTGLQMQTITGGKLPALEHEVRHVQGMNTYRWAVVFFFKADTAKAASLVA